jgi:hypothetical protein
MIARAAWLIGGNQMVRPAADQVRLAHAPQRFAQRGQLFASW